MKNLAEKYPTVVTSSIAIMMLLLAIPPMWPYGYYTLLRLVVTGAGIFAAFMAYGMGKNVWTYILGGIALLFNPLIPVHLDKETWGVIDLVVAIAFFVSIWCIRVNEEEK